MITTDTHADTFIQRWQGKDGSEKANLQLFLSELCELLGVEKPQPAHADNTLNAYVFDLWRRRSQPCDEGYGRCQCIPLE